MVRGLQRVLSRHHDVVALDSAKGGLTRCLAGEDFDLILCDLMMPDMTGMEPHRELARTSHAQAGRMIFMTAGAFTVEARQFLSESLKEHVEKPFDPGTSARSSSAISRRRVALESALPVRKPHRLKEVLGARQRGERHAVLDVLPAIPYAFAHGQFHSNVLPERRESRPTFWTAAE